MVNAQTMMRFSSLPLYFLAVMLGMAPAGAVDRDTTSNEVFDIWYFGNGEIGQFGALSGVINPRTQLDTQQMTGYVDWSETNKTNYWSQDEGLKKMVVQAVNTWTDAITNRLDMNKQARKLRLGVFLDDSTWSGSSMTSAYGFCRSYSVQTNFEKDSSYNSYSIVEWTLVHNYETDYYKRPNTAYARNTNLLLPGEQNIDVGIFLNTKELTWEGNNPVWVNRSKEDMLRTAAHELGHAMGFNSDLYILKPGAAVAGTSMLSGNMNRWDSLLTLDGQRIASVQFKEGSEKIKQATCLYGSLEDLHAAAWDPAMQPGNIQYDPERRLSLESGDDKTGVFVSAKCIMGNTLVHLDNPEDWIDSRSQDVMDAGGGGATLYKNDLAALRMLGYTLAVPVPEPSSAALFMMGGLAGLCARFRRR